MTLKDLVKKKDKISGDGSEGQSAAENLAPPGITFVRSDTYSQEIIQPPKFDNDPERPTGQPGTSETSPRRGFGRLRKSSNASPAPSENTKETKRLTERLHLISRSSRASSTSSVNVPSDLPSITDAYSERGDKQETEARWEERATLLAKENATVHSRPPTSEMSQLKLSGDGKASSERSSSRPRSVSDAASDENIQEAIRLHEARELEKATEMFGRLAENGNVLSQVLYGLSLRHGWGCTADPARAVTYLTAAASNSASVEAAALKAGMKKGGAAKGELVLAIFELANCFRYGWGVDVDKVAARQYYETAANLGDVDAMNEAAWCYLEGFGGKKDKVGIQLHFFAKAPIPHPGTRNVKDFGRRHDRDGHVEAAQLEPQPSDTGSGNTTFAVTIHPPGCSGVRSALDLPSKAKPPDFLASGHARFPLTPITHPSPHQLHFGQQCMITSTSHVTACLAVAPPLACICGE